MGKKRAKKSPISGRLSKAIQDHADDPTTYRKGYRDLPPGISGGIARLADARLGQFKTGVNEGETYLYLAGIVAEPVTVTHVKKVFKDGKIAVVGTEEVETEGQRTSQTIPLCDTTNSKGDVIEVGAHVDRALNELRMLGADTSGMSDEQDLENILEALVEEKPFFKFSTSAGTPTAQYPEPRVWENWEGCRGLEDYAPPESDDMEDGGEDEEEEEPEEDEEESEEEETEEEEDEEEEDEEEEEQSLGELADEGDAGAIANLTSSAEAAGLDPDDYPTWVELDQALAESEEEEEEEDEEEEDQEEDPVKGSVYLYKPPKKPKTECEVTAVFSKKRTVNLRSLDDQEVFKGIPWTKLES